MLMKQMSVFVENTTGTIADTVDFGILRCIVEDPEKATEILKEHGFTASITEVIAVSVEDKPGGLDKILKAFAAAGIGIDYIYSTIRAVTGEATIIMKVEEPKKALEILGM